VPAADGTTDFSVLQNELKGKSTKIVMVAFDLLYLNGYDLRKLPLAERKAHLKKLIAKTDIQFSESFEGDGREIHTQAPANGNHWDGIYLGRRNGKDLVYAGKVDHGFDKTSAAELRRRLTPLIRKTQPYSKRIAHKAIWVEPELLAEIEYRARSAEGKVRHPFFKGLRDDL
jgi:bifunctional non-homologous end joining protein LigD